ncbi:acyl-CoA dehydrogenase family protein [Acidisoma silvae]|uniref:Acyl-CoA/acyl-ACP dehydrogenase n=1 Tax=Acidisoma silvae TaxID=2802396 RepID=A0A963YXT3_9PROT|nr:acyl-CoA dehydrogenase family protein [Acidisoma silvae]MCB8878153.1 acyl-CoA/acyl-ACP dehydrogenase [Acidisoma silvae]
MKDFGTLIDRARTAAIIAAAHADSVDIESCFPHESLEGLKQNRLLGLLIPERFGGPGATLRDVALVCRILGQACGSSALIYAMHQIQVACLVATARGAAWQEAFLRRANADQLLLASVTSEVGTGGNIRSSLCAPEYEGNRLTLRKRSPAISYGEHADAFLVTARRSNEAPSSDQILIVAERTDSALVETSRWNALGMRGTDSKGFDISFSANAAQIISVPFDDIAQHTMLPTSHILWGSVWLGIATDATEKARAFLRNEAHHNADALPPGAVRLEKAVSMLSSMRARLDSAVNEYLNIQISDREALPLGFLAEVNGLKIAMSEAALAAVHHAMLICGIAGYKYGTPFSLGRHMRDLHSAPLMVNNDRIAANTAALLVAQRASLMKE